LRAKSWKVLADYGVGADAGYFSIGDWIWEIGSAIAMLLKTCADASKAWPAALDRSFAQNPALAPFGDNRDALTLTASSWLALEGVDFICGAWRGGACRDACLLLALAA